MRGLVGTVNGVSQLAQGIAGEPGFVALHNGDRVLEHPIGGEWDGLLLQCLLHDTECRLTLILSQGGPRIGV